MTNNKMPSRNHNYIWRHHGMQWSATVYQWWLSRRRHCSHRSRLAVWGNNPGGVFSGHLPIWKTMSTLNSHCEDIQQNHLPILPTSQMPRAHPSGVKRVPRVARSNPSSSLLGTAMLGSIPSMFPTTSIPPHLAIFHGGLSDLLIFSSSRAHQPSSLLDSFTYSGILHRSLIHPSPKYPPGKNHQTRAWRSLRRHGASNNLVIEI